MIFSNNAQILNGASCGGIPIGQGACGGTNAVSDIHGFEILEIFPNPFNSSIKVSLLTTNSHDLTFEVFDQLGKRLLYIDKKGGQSEYELAIPEEIPAGMYFLETTIGKESIVVTKIIKL